MTMWKTNQARRSLFVLLAGVVSIPWLAPCTLGVGTIASGLIDHANTTAFHGSDALKNLPSKELRAWAKLPGPLLAIQSNAHISRGMLVDENEVDRLVSSRIAGLHRGTSGVVSGISTVLAVSDLLTRVMADQNDSSYVTSGKVESRQELVICESPFVMLHAGEIRWGSATGTRDSLKVRAAWRPKMTIITPDGTYFCLATRIHYHASSPEVILEGNPTVQSGQQHVKAQAPGALMKLNFVTRTVSVEGKVHELRF